MKRTRSSWKQIVTIASVVVGGGIGIIWFTLGTNPRLTNAQTPVLPPDKTQKQSTFFEKWPTDTPTPLPTATPLPTSTPKPVPTSKPDEIKCEKADVYVLNDTSSSMQTADFLLQMEFNKRLIEKINPTQESTHVGISLFDHGVYQLIQLSGNKAALLQAIPLMRTQQGATAIGNALNHAYSQLEGAAGRKDVPQIILLVTDGGSNDITPQHIKSLRDANIHTLVVGVWGNPAYENAYRDLMLQVAGRPDRLFTMRTFDQLVATVDQIARTACSISTSDQSGSGQTAGAQTQSITASTEVCKVGDERGNGCRCESAKNGKGLTFLCENSSRVQAGNVSLYRSTGGDAADYYRYLGTRDESGMRWELPGERIPPSVFTTATQAISCAEVCLEAPE